MVILKSKYINYEEMVRGNKSKRTGIEKPVLFDTIETIRNRENVKWININN